MRYQKKPVMIEAVQFTRDTVEDAKRFCPVLYPQVRNEQIEFAFVQTLEGQVTASLGDYIIKGVEDGEFYPCKPDIFRKTYEAVRE